MPTARRPSTTRAAGKPASPRAGTKTAKGAAPVKLPVPAASKEHPSKPVKHKLVRDSFTMPGPDFALIAALKARMLAAQRETKKSELLRAGLQVLAALNDQQLVAALGRLQPIKIGRPKKH